MSEFLMSSDIWSETISQVLGDTFRYVGNVGVEDLSWVELYPTRI